MPSQNATKPAPGGRPAARAKAAATRVADAAGTPAAEAKPAPARAPKRQRGRLRVAAILAAGREVLREKGYDATTMTEIAARSGTAIGSLYRFFPSKESLADALLQDYAEQMVAGLAYLAVSTDVTSESLANALVDLMLTLQEERSVALVLSEARGGGSADLKARYRKAMRQGVGQILKKLAPQLPRGRAEAMATVVVHLLKGVVRTTEEEDPAACRSVLTEIRELIRLYLNTVH